MKRIQNANLYRKLQVLQLKFLRYLDDDFPDAPIDYRISEPAPQESEEEFRWFIEQMRNDLSKIKTQA